MNIARQPDPPPTGSAPPSGPRPGEPEPPSGPRRRDGALLDLDPFVESKLRRPARWARALGVARHDAEDIVQDALVALCENTESVAPPARSDWLRRTLEHRRRRHGRTRLRAQSYAPRIGASLHEAQLSQPSPEELLAQRERARVVRWLVDQVAPKRREVAERYVFGDGSLEEVAEELGLPIGTVRSRWDRAKDDMRAAAARHDARRRGRSGWLLLAALLAALWTAVVVRLRRRARPLLACLAVPLAVTRHDVLDAPSKLGAAVAASPVPATEDEPALPHAAPADRPSAVLPNPPVLPSAVLPSAVLPSAAVLPSPVLPSAAPVAGRAAAPRDPSAAVLPSPVLPSAAAVAGRAAAPRGPSEDTLIRLATSALARSPGEAIALLREHERRFPSRNVPLRDELFRQAFAAQRAAAPPARSHQP